MISSSFELDSLTQMQVILLLCFIVLWLNYTRNYHLPCIKPVPVLKLVPGLPPWKKVVMVPISLMIWPTHAHINLWFVKKGSTVLTHSWFVLTSDQCIDHHYNNNRNLHHEFSVTPSILGSTNKSEQLTNNQWILVAFTWAPADRDPEHVRWRVRASGSQDCTGW